MWGWIAKKLATSILSRWVLGGLVALLLGGGGLLWHNHKEGLRDEGALECVQEINQSTIDALENALADEKSARAELRAKLDAAAVVNAEARARQKNLQSKLENLSREREEQKKNDEQYEAWSRSDLPDGVAERVREAARRKAGNST